MNSAPTLISKECDTTPFPVSKRRTPSLSSSSSSSSSSFPYLPDDSPISPFTPLRSSGGIPFSWEQLPGIPKKTSHNKKDYSPFKQDLPLPPPHLPAASSERIYKSEGIGFKKKISNDPFFAALVKCSKDDKVTKSISDRFGFIRSYTCKSTCSVSESIVYLPRSRKATSYNRIRHSRSL